MTARLRSLALAASLAHCGTNAPVDAAHPSDAAFDSIDAPSEAATGGFATIAVTGFIDTVDGGTSAGAIPIGVSVQPSSYQAPCTRTTMSNCTILLCPTGYGTVAAPFPTAGTVTLTGAPFATAQVLIPMADGTYTALDAPGASWTAGNGVQFQATGSPTGVPTFAQGVSIAPDTTITLPVFSATTALTIDRTQDLAITWTANGSAMGDLSFRLTESALATGASEVTCRFDLAPGSAVVPTAVLSLLPAGHGGVTIQSEGHASLQLGGWAVDMELLSPTAASGSVIVQ